RCGWSELRRCAEGDGVPHRRARPPAHQPGASGIFRLRASREHADRGQGAGRAGYEDRNRSRGRPAQSLRTIGKCAGSLVIAATGRLETRYALFARGCAARPVIRIAALRVAALPYATFFRGSGRNAEGLRLRYAISLRIVDTDHAQAAQNLV